MHFHFRAICLFLFTLLIVGCSDDQTMTGGNDNTGDPVNDNAEIWTGSNMTFTKSDDTDPTDANNQDKLTDNVIITRGTSGGQIFNIATESSFNKNDSPVGTEWALGRTDNINNLTFRPFRSAVGEPQDVVGKNLVLHLIEDDIYLNINFTSWSSGRTGGFAYERATP